MPLLKVKEKNTCTVCVDSILQDAIYLPCFNTICSSHINDWKPSEHSTYVECLLCHNRHSIVDCERRNDQANQIIEADGHLTDLEIGLKNFSFKNIHDLKLNFDAYNNNRRYMDELNVNHFDRILIEIDAKREELKVEIDNIADEFKRDVILSKRRYAYLLDEINNFDLTINPHMLNVTVRNELRRAEIDFDELDRLNHLSIDKIIKLKKMLVELSVTERHINNNFFEKNNDKLIRRNFFGTLRTDLVDRSHVTREAPNIERPVFISYSDIKLGRTESTTSIRVRQSPAIQASSIASSLTSTPQIRFNLQQTAHVSVKP